MGRHTFIKIKTSNKGNFIINRSCCCCYPFFLVDVVVVVVALLRLGLKSLFSFVHINNFFLNDFIN